MSWEIFIRFQLWIKYFDKFWEKSFWWNLTFVIQNFYMKFCTSISDSAVRVLLWFWARWSRKASCTHKQELWKVPTWRGESLWASPPAPPSVHCFLTSMTTEISPPPCSYDKVFLLSSQWTTDWNVNPNKHLFLQEGFAGSA